MSKVRSISVYVALSFALVVPRFAHATPAESTPPPSTGAPSVPAVDVPDPNDPVDHLAVITGIARKKGRRVMRELRVREFDLPNAVAAVRRTTSDGTEDVFVAYEVSLFNRCVFENAPEGREAIRARREDCAGERGIETKIAHVRIAPTPRGRTEDTGGALAFVGDPVSLGFRGASYAQMSSQVFFDGMGPVDASRTSEMRIWVAVTAVDYEESNDARGEFERNDWFGQGEQRLRIYDDELGVSADESIVAGELMESAGVPAVTFDARTRILEVRTGERHLRFRYDAERDTFAPAS